MGQNVLIDLNVFIFLWGTVTPGAADIVFSRGLLQAKMPIKETCLFNYIENFTTKKRKIFR